MIVGRSEQIGRLDRLLAEVAAGGGGVLVVCGEPGVGVTALLDVFARRATRRDLRVVRARGSRGEASGGLVRDVARMLEAPDARDEDALVVALAAAAGSRPVVVVVDDVGEADRESQALLARAATRAAAGCRVAVVVGARSIPRPVPSAYDRWQRLVLAPLDEESSLALLRGVVGHGGVHLPLLARRLHGNPAALVAVATALGPHGLDDDVPLVERLPLPPTLVAAWSEALPDDGPRRDALLRAAVCEPAPPAGGLRCLDDLARTLLAGSPWVELHQPLLWPQPWVRDVVVATAAAADVRRAHARLARHAAEIGAAPSVVAHHLTRSTAGTDEVVADALELQARRAEALGLPDVGASTWAAAALCSADGDRRVDRAVAGARGLTATGPGMDAVDDLLRVLEGAELEPGPAAVRDRLRALKRAGLDPDAKIAALQGAVGHARAEATDLLPNLLWELSVVAGQHGDTAVGVAAAEEYRSLEEAGAATGAPGWAGAALLSAARFQAGDVAGGEDLRRLVRDASSGLDPAAADLDLLFNAVLLDDLILDLSPRASDRLLHLVQRLDGEAYPVACLYGIQGWRARARGDLVTARRMLRHGLDVAIPASAVDVACGLAALAAELSAIQGDDELERSAVAMRSLMEGAGDLRRLATLDRALGLRALAEGRLEEAVVHLSAAAGAPMLGRGLRDGVLMGRLDLVEVLLRVGDRAGALHRGTPVLAVLDEMDEPLAGALAARLRGLLAEDDAAALRRLDDALVRHAGAADTFEHARTFLARGERLRRSRRRGEARLDLLEAVRRFEAIGAAPWLARARSELRASGGDPGGDPASDGDLGLTPQELSVARAAARGASNREVAEALFLSPRTVEYHLGNVYRKLGVHGRGALGSRLLATAPGRGHE